MTCLDWAETLVCAVRFRCRTSPAVRGNPAACRHLGPQVVQAQEALERRLAMLDSHQRGIHEALSGMEHEAARLAREESALQDDATRYAD